MADLTLHTLSRRIARDLAKLDGLCLDNEPERRKLGRWIAKNILTGRFTAPRRRLTKPHDANTPRP